MLVTYPINAMRNMAMLLARTELVYPLDIDFVVSSDLSDVVRDPDRRGSALFVFPVPWSRAANSKLLCCEDRPNAGSVVSGLLPAWPVPPASQQSQARNSASQHCTVTFSLTTVPRLPARQSA